jgi:hypothetical protein
MPMDSRSGTLSKPSYTVYFRNYRSVDIYRHHVPKVELGRLSLTMRVTALLAQIYLTGSVSTYHPSQSQDLAAVQHP